MWNKNIETFIGCDAEYEEANIVIFGAPFYSTTTYRPGTKFASKKMRSDLLDSRHIAHIKIEI